MLHSHTYRGGGVLPLAECAKAEYPSSVFYPLLSGWIGMRFFLRSQSMGFAAIALGSSVLLSRVMGLVRDKIISYYFGASPEADIYFAAFVVPDFLNYLLAGGYFSITLVPLLTSAFLKDERDAWRFFSSACLWAALSIALLTLLAGIFVEPIARVIAPGFPPESIERLCFFLRIILPAQVCFLPGACFTAMLYYRKQFTIPAITPLVYNGVIILCGVAGLWLFPSSGMTGFCVGVSSGAFLGSFLLPVLAVRAGGMQFIPNLLHPGMKRVLVLALPLMLGQSIVVLDEQFIRIFGSLAGEGSVSLLSYARRIMLVPVGVIAQAAGLASYPFLASLLAKGEKNEFNLQMNKALSSTILVALPVSLWMMVTAEPIIRLIFRQGSFNTADASAAGLLLAIMMSVVVFWSMQQVLGRAFYACQDMLTPAILGSIATVFVLPLYYLGAVHLGAQGVAGAGCAGVVIYTVLLWFRWKKRHGEDCIKGVAFATVKAFLFCLPACGAGIIASYLIQLWFTGRTLYGAFLQILASGLAFALCYFIIFIRFCPDLCEPLLLFFRKILHRLKRNN